MSGKVFKLALVVVFACAFASCKPSQKFPKNENGVIVATQSSIPKSAVRLKGEIVELKEKSAERSFYLYRVTEVVAKGGTFGTVLPTKGEVVVLATAQHVKFKNGDVVLVDAATPLMKESDLLSISML